jgi:hypothetical protein
LEQQDNEQKVRDFTGSAEKVPPAAQTVPVSRAASGKVSRGPTSLFGVLKTVCARTRPLWNFDALFFAGQYILSWSNEKSA